MASTDTHSTTTLSTGRTYSHIHIAPTRGNKPTILFLHGFPGTSYLWRRQIGHFAAAGYGVVVPDLLGYRGTDKPAELEAYGLKRMAGEVVELLEALEVGGCFGVGHDWFVFSYTAVCGDLFCF